MISLSGGVRTLRTCLCVETEVLPLASTASHKDGQASESLCVETEVLPLARVDTVVSPVSLG